MLLVSTGGRAVEMLSFLVKHSDFKSNTPKLFIRGQFTRRNQRVLFLIEEMTKQLKAWLDYKRGYTR
jgi:integrase